LTTAPKHHLADPALAARLVKRSAVQLLDGQEPEIVFPREGTYLGGLFESMAAISVRTYAQRCKARVFHLRTRGGRQEIDFIVETGTGFWGWRPSCQLASMATMCAICYGSAKGSVTNAWGWLSSMPGRRPMCALTASRSSPWAHWAREHLRLGERRERGEGLVRRSRASRGRGRRKGRTKWQSRVALVESPAQDEVADGGKTRVKSREKAYRHGSGRGR